jgi:hypothetical protein
MLFICPFDSNAETPWESPEPRWGITLLRQGGATEYTAETKIRDPFDQNREADYRTHLEFPLDIVLLGITAVWESGPATERRFGGSINLFAKITDPSDIAYQSQWLDDYKVGAGGSETELDMIIVSAGLDYRITGGRQSVASLVVCYQYQKISYRLLGYDQLSSPPWEGPGQDIPATVHVANYEVNYVSIQPGVKGDFWVDESWHLGADASLGPVYATDTENRLARARYSCGSGWGVGLTLRATIDLLPGAARPAWLWGNLTGEFTYLNAEGHTDRRWYRDTDQPAGTEFADIPYELRSVQTRIGVTLGASF